MASQKRQIRLIATTDVHGMLWPWDHTSLAPAAGSLARVCAYVRQCRREDGDDGVALLDGGDMLQGQPGVYMYNFLDRSGETHPVVRMMHHIGYDAVTVGNHDIETGHEVYDRVRRELAPVPMLGANVTDTSTGEPYFIPYTVLTRAGLRIAVLGLVTPAVPAWLPEPLWHGMRFDDPVESARKWVSHIRENEHPDLVVALVHSGYRSTHLTRGMPENVSASLAAEVSGIDVIFMGHDHVATCRREGAAGTLLINPGAHAHAVAEVTVSLTSGGRVESLEGRVVPVDGYEPDPEFTRLYAPERDAVTAMVNEVIGYADGDFSIRDAYFGPSAFMELIHRLQLQVTGAQISLAAPTLFDGGLAEGPLRMAHTFTLYRYENQLCTLRMSGREIKEYLEMSYNLWTAVMNGPDDSLLKFADGYSVKGDFARLINPTYNYDSAMGIDYEVDVREPKGNKIKILRLSDGTPWREDEWYEVAVNTYRANGGGELLTRGAGIAPEELGRRVVRATEHD
ncbi:MAG: bifunctional metallophosphatase/5'-nucleotidase, partial [Duncaniella sp.]|nr:bifunctional metallophosphatase/5'-nucleotidase [Duncaniella sp.]